MASKPHPQYLGVSLHSFSGRQVARWEAHIPIEGRPRCLYLGGFVTAEQAAEAYDVAALKIEGAEAAFTNFPLSRYTELLPALESIDLTDLINELRQRGYDALPLVDFGQQSNSAACGNFMSE
ncbi:hypothetical protein PLESTB_000207500 [Pleodorina starrii]|uniref:AP2/ERF domain-containing protein n=1 Tax=Pleodorina starrii TaxID=330485 RepID=A0A9W6BBX7_9CHLO|nr:hypothetical protein PLESTB_000207500 [Pleodorina starrii]